MTQDNTPPADELSLFGETRRSNWVRLRTLIILRWIAIGGQLAAIMVAGRLFDLNLNTGLCVLVVGVLAVTNLVAMFVFPENRRLSEGEMVALLLFDITQLAVLLALTGGLHNPFALLILAPVTISATALQWRSAVLVGAVAMLLISLIAVFHLPLRTELGYVMRMPRVFVVGFWVAIEIGIVFIGVYARRVTVEVNDMADALAATQMALAREQKLTDLGGVVAAAAHELGTPLATITLVASELADDLEAPEHRADALLIREQADRCRDILRSMGQAGKDDKLMRYAPIGAVVAEAAEPHANRGKRLIYQIGDAAADAEAQPVILRRPEIVHGLRNFIQNAVDFAGSTVWVEIHWTEAAITLRIFDDGPGFPPNVLPRLGDPFIRFRRDAPSRAARPGYEGMGLGLFIAKTLLERTGAEITFANGRDPRFADRTQRTGAVIELVWPRSAIAAPRSVTRAALGDNIRFSG